MSTIPLSISPEGIPLEGRPSGSARVVLAFVAASAISLIGSASLLAAAVLIH